MSFDECVTERDSNGLALVALPPGKRAVSIMAAGAASGKKKAKGVIDQEQIVLQFNQMRQECRSILNKIGELEMEVNEHGYDSVFSC